MGEVTWHPHRVKREDREKLLGQRGCLIWFTGLSGSGKSTVAQRLSERLHGRGKLTYVLDGDNIRQGLNSDLCFTPEDRAENIRRVGEVARLLVDAGIITIAAFISPYRRDRDAIRAALGDRFIELHVRCDISVCEERDSKGLYKKAKRGEIEDFTGVSAPYEEPLNPEVTLDTTETEVDVSVDKVIKALEERGLI
jgi:adenylylsulfate kinase